MNIYLIIGSEFRARFVPPTLLAVALHFSVLKLNIVHEVVEGALRKLEDRSIWLYYECSLCITNLLSTLRIPNCDTLQIERPIILIFSLKNVELTWVLQSRLIIASKFND